MAATLRDLQAQLGSGRTHYGFGQEPVPPQRTKEPNTALALFILEHVRPPQDQAELDAFMKARETTKEGKAT